MRLFDSILLYFVSRCTGNSLWQPGLELKARRPNRSSAPQQGSCCSTAEIPAPWLGEGGGGVQGGGTALCMLSEAVSALQLHGWLSHPPNGSIIQSQAPIHATLTQLTQADTWQERWMIWEQPPQLLDQSLYFFSCFCSGSLSITAEPICGRLMLYCNSGGDPPLTPAYAIASVITKLFGNNWTYW